MGLLLSILLGFLPMLVFAWLVFWIDRYEKEPLILLCGVFTWGALVAAGAAFLTNTLLGAGIYLFTRSVPATNLATASLIAPVVEEVLKGMAVLLVFLIAREEFDSLLDGIVYAAIAALGFAATENVFYIYQYGFQQGGLPGLISMAFVRIVLVGWQHPFYSAFVGIGLALARLNSRRWVSLLAGLSGLAAAVLLHAVHNTAGTLLGGGAGLLAMAVFDWSGWTLMALFAAWAVTRERGWLVEHLREEVSLGTISAAQYRTACSAWVQGKARLTGLMHGRFRATSRFYQVCGEISHKKHQLALMGQEKGNSQIVADLRGELFRLSPLVAN
jgi:RsiW-degrading membrane proteinase PrsW (M82 family)